MNDLILFNQQINQQLKNRFKRENWSGTSPKFYKNDVQNLIKYIEIRKSINQDFFSCYLKIYSNFTSSNAKKRKTLQPSNEIFLVGISPKSVSDSAYNWRLNDDKDFNNKQLNLLWEALTTHGKLFFDRFADFPTPFLNIKPEDFKKGMVKLFNTYEVYNQVNYMNFLKEIHWSLDQKETAHEFSRLAIERFTNNLEGKNVVYDNVYKNYLRSLEVPRT